MPHREQLRIAKDNESSERKVSSKFLTSYLFEFKDCFKGMYEFISEVIHILVKRKRGANHSFELLQKLSPYFQIGK